MLTSAMRKEKKNFLAVLSKSAGLIKKLVDKSLYLLFSKKSVAKMWIIFENKFQHIFSISVTRIFLNAYTIRLSNCTNIINYTIRYQITFEKLLGLLNNKL